MKFNLDLDTNAISQPQGFLDWITFAIVCIVTFNNLFCLLFVRIKSKTFIPLRSKTNIFIYGLIICGLINLWGNFIANEHLTFLISIHRYSCVLWSFWIIFIALSGWFIFMFMRLLYRSYQFHPKFKDLTEDVKYILCNWTLLLVISPMISICIYATYFESNFFDVSKLSCTTETTAKIMVLTWICTCGIALLIVSLILERAIRDEWLTEYKIHRKIITLAIIVTVINVAINFIGLQRYMIGRCVFTLLIAVLHYYCISKLLYFKIYESLKKDSDYEVEYLGSALGWDTSMFNIREVSKSKDIMDHFLDYCSKKKPVTINSRIEPGKTKLIFPQNTAELYIDIMKWRNFTYFDDSHRLIGMSLLVSRCSKAQTNFKSDNIMGPETLIKVPSGQIERKMFDKLILELLDDFQEAWGKEYLENFNKKTVSYDLKQKKEKKSIQMKGISSEDDLDFVLKSLA